MLGSTKAMFTVLEDKVADADTFDGDNAIVGDWMITHVGVVSSGQFRAMIPLQDVISERPTPDTQPFIACPALRPTGGRSVDV